ncbi:MAG: potassium transporter Kup [Polyangiales bacterium]
MSEGSGSHGHGPADPQGLDLVLRAIGAVGVVYGDIGTSPLYALKECFAGEHGLRATDPSVLGVVSLFCWSLICVVVVKYLTFLMQADNHGEGGILALLALVQQKQATPQGKQPTTLAAKGLLLAGLFGAALLYGDGMITPAISVLSAVEGLGRATPHDPGMLTPYILPITIVILFMLFVFQSGGTKKVGAVFGPVMITWFTCIALAGIPWILKRPDILHSLDPRHGLYFLTHHQWKGFLVLGSVVLCVTGGEALYADMGHFGRKPIRLAWYAIVFPALAVNYLGQGARLLHIGHEGVEDSFYGVFPEWAVLPMVVLATLATVVASQALISGAFSLSRQAIQLGFSPRMTIVHTSEDTEGEIYVPEINWLLMISCIGLVVGFRSSSNLAAAYGIAVTGTMMITSVLFFAAMRPKWGTAKTAALVVFFLVFDLAFFGANVVKIAHGGWFPLLVGAIFFAVMTTWKRGRGALFDYIQAQTKPLQQFMSDLETSPPHRVDGTAVVMTSSTTGAPPILVHHLLHNKVLHENIVLLSIVTERVPEISASSRVRLKELGGGFYHVVAKYGFMQTPNVMEILERVREGGVDTSLESTTFFLGRETLLSGGKSGLMNWRKSLFAFLSRNALPATHFFKIPSDRVVEIGMQIPL